MDQMDPMRTPRLIAGSLLLAAALATPASACRVGGDRVLFEATPPSVPAGLGVVRVRFANTGEAFERWRRRAPRSEGGDLIGVLRQADGGQVPVYHPVTSCTHGFFGKSPAAYDRIAVLVGRFVPIGPGANAFYAAGDWNGRWIAIR